MNLHSSNLYPSASSYPNVRAHYDPIRDTGETAATTLKSSAVSTPLEQNERRDNPLWKSQYEKWKKSSFGKSDAWKDAHIPAHLKVFREHDKATNNELDVKNYALTNYVSTPDPKNSTRDQIKAYYKERLGLDIDPDTTYLITFAYNVRGHKPPYPGTVVSKISLTEAAIKNRQDTPGHKALPRVSFNKHDTTPPPIKVVDDLTIGYHRSSGRHAYQNSPNSLQTQQYEGIYFEPPGEEIYDASSQVPLSPKSFRNYVWDTSFSKAHKAELDNFWSANKETYTTLAKASFASAAYKQFEEGSMTRQGRDLALRVANISPDKKLESLTANDFQAAYVQDPDLEVKHLTFRGHESSNIIYVTDKITQKTLLYIPGNSSPIHEFSNPEAMRKWLTNQMTDPNKRAQFGEHFKLRDRADSVWEAGLDSQLEHMEMYAEGHVRWLEGRPFGGTAINGDPFKSIQERVEKFTYNDADSTYVSNDDQKKKRVLQDLKSASSSLIILAPLALAFPPVGVATLLFDAGVALTEIGFGVDDHLRGRPGATDRIVFGSLNAAKIVGKELGSKVIGGAVTPFIKPSIEQVVLPQINPS